MGTLDVCDMNEYCRLETSEKAIATLGDIWWPQTAKQNGDRMSQNSTSVLYGRSVVSAQM